MTAVRLPPPALGRWSLRAIMTAALALGAVAVMATATIPGRVDYTPVTSQAADALLRGATVQVMAFGCDLSRHEGTAVAVDGHLLTNQHVVAGTRMIDVVAADQATQQTGAASVALAGDVADIPGTGVKSTGLTFAASDPSVGNAVRLAGFPSAPTGQREPGLVIDSYRVVDYVPGGSVDQPWPVMRLSGPARPGMSGGPVLDGHGRLAGIEFGNEVQSGDALVIPASALRRLVTSGGFVPVSC